MEREKLHYEFSSEKNQKLINERGIGFEEVIEAINEGAIIDTITHHNADKYPNQAIYLINIRGYIYLVPFVRKDKQTVFLKTIFPSRKFTKKYLGK